MQELRSWLPAVPAVLLGFILASWAGAQPPTQPAPPKKIVSDVIIQGNRLVSTENIKNQMRTRPGREYLAETLQEDVRTLYATMLFGNVWADIVADGPNRIKVHVYIRDLTNLVERVIYKGNNNLTNDDLEQLTQIRRGMPLNPTSNKVACGAIVRKYNEDGRPFASCDLIKGGKTGDAEVIFNITEGPKVKVRAIRFTGNTFVSSAVLKNRIDSSAAILGVVGGTWNPAMADNDVHKLTEYYRSFGYHDVKINRELMFTGDGRELHLVFHIQEGVRYRVSNTPWVIGARSVPHEALEAIGKVKAGDLYDGNKINADLARIKDYLGYRGHDVQANPVLSFELNQQGTVKVTYEVVEKSPTRIGQITIVGGTPWQQGILRRELPLSTGQILTIPNVKRAESALTRMNLFASGPQAGRVTLTVLENPPPDPKNPVKDVLISIQETSTGSLLLGAAGANSVPATAVARPAP